MPRMQIYKPESHALAFSRFLTNQESGGEHRAFCPLCEDPDTSKSASASFNFDKNVYHCMSCGEGMSVAQLVKKLKTEKGFDLRSERLRAIHADPNAAEKYRAKARSTSSGPAPLPTNKQIEAWNSRLLKAPSHMSTLLEKRGFSEETIIDWQIGWDGQRYTIPVYDVEGELVNVRRYKPSAASSDKMYSIAGHGEARIFAPSILDSNEVIVLTEGETDCILLNQYGIPAVTHTAGATAFQRKWGPLFEGKEVYICFDNDEPGQKGAQKAQGIIKKYARACYIVEIPIPVKGADITDFLVKEGYTADDFRELMEESTVEEPEPEPVPIETRPVPPAAGQKVTLEDSMGTDYQDKVLELTVQVAGKQNPPYLVPRNVHVTCDQAAGPMCAGCPIGALNGDTTVTFQPDDVRLFKFLKQNDTAHNSVFKQITGARCNQHVTYEIDDRFNMEQLIVGNAIDDREAGVSQTPITREVYSVGTHATPVNTTVRMVAANVPDPKDNRLSMMAWSNEQVKTQLDNFQMTDEMIDELRSFQREDTQTPLEKCREIAEHNQKFVTEIYGRPLLHIGYDLVWHSPMAFYIDGQLQEKGWLEMMVVGDTRTGKSETAIRLAKYYQAGIVKSCEGATFAGLVGGAQQLVKSGPWTVTWGLIPLNDRRLVVLDEVSGLKDKDVIENMSAIRSSGRAEITKITSEETSARTRLIWITNPGDGSMIGDHPEAGIAALRTVVKANEDIARFDYVMAATASEVDPKVINSRKKARQGRPVYTSEMCQSLVLWAWSRRPDQIQFSERALTLAREEAVRMGDKYIADPPLLQVENARLKIYRIAAAMAARTFSTSDGETLMVYKEHVESAVEFLDEIYAFEGMGYARRSRRVLDARRAAQERRTACVSFLLANPDTVLHTLQSIGGTTFRPRDFVEIGNMTVDASHEVTKKLIGWKMVLRKTRGDLSMDRTLVNILREFDDREYED